jgi:pyridoxine 5-phosphate synthase
MQSHPTKLSVNVNKIATLRNTRALDVPSVRRFAKIALDAGAAGITVHPRPDERHIRSHDVEDLATLLKGYPHAEYNIEGNPLHGLVEHCRRVRPHQATLVPDAVGASTSNQGFRLSQMPADEQAALRKAIDHLHAAGCRVSLFMDPDPVTIARAKSFGADRVELYTEPYARHFAMGRTEASIAQYAAAAAAARAAGLGVNAGHDLSLNNLGAFLAGVKGVEEVSIGHALIADALEFGMADAVRRYARICGRGS